MAVVNLAVLMKLFHLGPHHRIPSLHSVLVSMNHFEYPGPLRSPFTLSLSRGGRVGGDDKPKHPGKVTTVTSLNHQISGGPDTYQTPFLQRPDHSFASPFLFPFESEWVKIFSIGFTHLFKNIMGGTDFIMKK